MSAFFDAVGVFFDHLASVRFAPLGIALALHVLKLACRAIAWRTILRASFPESVVRYRTILGAYLAGVGINSVAPARSGDVVKLYLVKHRIDGATYAALAPTLVVETIFDFFVAGAIMVWAGAIGVLPAREVYARLPSVDWGWFVEHNRVTLAILAILLVAGVVAYVWARRRLLEFREHVAQGFAILHDRPRFIRGVILPQAVSWVLRIAALYYFLKAFGVHASIHNALLVQVVDSLATLFPATPGGAGTKQGLIVLLFEGEASRTLILSFSVGMNIALVVANLAVGFAALALMARTLSWKRLRRRQQAEEQPRDEVRLRVPARDGAGARAAVHLRGRRRTSSAARSSPSRSGGDGRAASSSRVDDAPPGRRRPGRRSTASSAACRPRSSSSRSGSPTTTARRRRARSRSSRRRRRSGGRSRRRRRSGTRSTSRRRVRRRCPRRSGTPSRGSSPRSTRAAANLLLWGATGSRQDRGLPPGLRGCARARSRRDRARAGDRARAADGRPRARAVRRPRRDPALGADRGGAPRRARADRGAARRRSSSAPGRPSSRRCRGSASSCVDEEHDQSYKQDSDPRYDARTIAAKRAALEGAVAVYGTATPRPESWARLERLELGGRVAGRLPPVRVVDLRREAGYPLSAPLLAELGASPSSGGKAILLLNRRGVAPALHCRACGTTIRCPNCDVALVLHRDRSAALPPLRPRASRRRDVPRVRLGRARTPRRRARSGSSGSSQRRSPSSSSSASTPTRRRARSARRGARAASPRPTAPCSSGRRWSRRDTTSRRRARGRRRRRHVARPARTSAPRSAPSSCITQLAGRSGRDAPGRVLVQTFQPDARPIAYAARHDVARLPRRRARAAARRSATRRTATSSVIVDAGPDARAAPLRALEELRDASADADVLGPAPLLRLRGRYRAQLVAKTDAPARRRGARCAAARRRGAVDAARRPRPRSSTSTRSLSELRDTAHCRLWRRELRRRGRRRRSSASGGSAT